MFVAFYYTRVGFYYTRVDWGFWISDFFDLGFGIWDLAFLKTGKIRNPKSKIPDYLYRRQNSAEVHTAHRAI